MLMDLKRLFKFEVEQERWFKDINQAQMEASLFALNNSEKCGGYTHFLQLKAASTAERTPIHIIATIDTSGSMQFDNKLDNVKKSLKAVLEFMSSK